MDDFIAPTQSGFWLGTTSSVAPQFRLGLGLIIEMSPMSTTPRVIQPIITGPV